MRKEEAKDEKNQKIIISLTDLVQEKDLEDKGDEF